MTFDKLRAWVVTRSLACAVVSFAVFLFAPLILPEFGMTMRWDQAWKYMQISLPVLLGYVASAVAFLVGQANSALKPEQLAPPLLVTISKASFYTYLAAFVGVVGVFAFSNRPTAPFGNGMSGDMFTTFLTGALSFLTVTTNSLVLILFGRAR